MDETSSLIKIFKMYICGIKGQIIFEIHTLICDINRANEKSLWRLFIFIYN